MILNKLPIGITSNIYTLISTKLTIILYAYYLYMIDVFYNYITINIIGVLCGKLILNPLNIINIIYSLL